MNITSVGAAQSVAQYQPAVNVQTQAASQCTGNCPSQAISDPNLGNHINVIA